MKKIILFSLLTAITTITYGQTITVTGSVSNEKSQPIPFAFIRDVQHGYATYADSVGAFAIKADPASFLEVLAKNYKTTLVKIDNKPAIKVMLPAGLAADGVTKLNIDSQDGATVNSFLENRQLMAQAVVGNNATQAIVKEGFNQEPTRGSRYLYDYWVPGVGVNNKDSLIVDINNKYNYDMLNGMIMYTTDGNSLSSILKDQTKSFSLYDKRGHAHVYENAPAISNKPFIEVLLNTPKYKIYKKIDGKLNRADFHTDGVLEMGHKYDEYVSVDHYYFIGADGKPQSISLKKSTLKKLLGTDGDVFINAQGGREVNDDYVYDLNNSLNK